MRRQFKDQEENNVFKRQTDLRSEPVERIITLGESTTWGYSVSDKSKCWVSQVVAMLEEIIDEDHCHPNDLGHRIIANRVFEAVVRNCSFVARQMPGTSLIQSFVEKYGNGPGRPSSN